jgi:hypothetical protein
MMKRLSSTSPRYACKAVVLQPNIGVGFVVIFDVVVQRPKTFREACVTHVPKCMLWALALRG